MAPPGTTSARRLAAVLLTAVLLTAVLAGCAGGIGPGPAAPPKPIPNVVGKRLLTAEEALDAAGFRATRQDASGQDRPVLDPHNWVVRGQRPGAGTRAAPRAEVTLLVTKPTDRGSAGAVRVGVVPDVRCRNLQSAQDALQAAGFYDLASEDATGQGRAQFLDRNWVVVAQSAPPGSRPAIAARIVLRVVKYGEPTGSSGCRS
jgi:hypothetical protein